MQALTKEQSDRLNDLLASRQPVDGGDEVVVSQPSLVDMLAGNEVYFEWDEFSGKFLPRKVEKRFTQTPVNTVVLIERVIERVQVEPAKADVSMAPAIVSLASAFCEWLARQFRASVQYQSIDSTPVWLPTKRTRREIEENSAKSTPINVQVNINSHSNQQS